MVQYKMTPNDFLEQLIELYVEARNSKFESPNIFRGRSSSVSSGLEDLFTHFIAINNPNICNYFIDQPMKFVGEKNIKYPDIVIQHQDGGIEHLVDMKADLGWNRHGMIEFCKEWEDRIEALKGTETSFKNGRSKQIVRGKFSEKLKYHIVVVSKENSGKKILDDHEKVIKDFKNVRLYILSDQIHPNDYKFCKEDILERINIKVDEFERLLNAVTANMS
jgi:hypothetical protein